MDLEQLRYPIGEFRFKDSYSLAEVKSNIQIISALPSRFINLLGGWDDEKYNTPYRPDGWTIRQLIHHVADSHINAYTRCRLALTEDNPVIKPYDEAAWAELPDGKAAQVELSLQLMRYVHLRWVLLLNSMQEAELARTYTHPATGRVFRMDEVIANYAWHSEHHYQHAFQLAVRNNWQ
ncbi:YfiT family bacillithiol transferase [Dyadobacter sediminis]|uniref:Putative metal-dependent hydrolase n=1 Tax=Dyadobacter sediminis TaxID=1493691 RepID=A0A5R9KAQ6_9BACT|nr:putative metal-dependent hydrolase [Dyadobacter sediminis]TLU91807.1 putative metal-dependent hydrolase [Dyadobacter sediminis]GGC00121.1 putative metal-dependent hydrolase [Dyadobacter sediminis]